MTHGDSQTRLKSLLAEYETLDPECDSVRIRQLMEEGAGLIDREVQPKKWAAFRYKYAQVSEEVDPSAALAAYRESIDFLDPEEDQELLADCHRAIGILMIHQGNLGSDAQEEAISHLEAAVTLYSDVAVWLAVLYQFRIAGDPWQNWKKRLEYLEIDATSIPKDEDPVRWARVQNELGIAMEEEPDANFYTALEKRFKFHLKALAALGNSINPTWIRTHLYLSECHLFRLGEDPEEDLFFAEQFNRKALDAWTDEFDVTLKIVALLGRVRILSVSKKHGRTEDLLQGLKHCEEAASLIDMSQPTHHTYFGNIESQRSMLLLGLIKLGQHERPDELLTHARNAIRSFSSEEHIRSRRIILQAAAEGLLVVEHFADAAGLLKEALKEAEHGLGSAETISARMERIWEFRDSSALLCWCLLKLGQVEEALLELDLGKDRFWSKDIQPWSMAELYSLVPSNGALLFANFAATPGAVVVVVEKRIEIVWLPQFGKNRVMELQRGNVDGLQLGGWLRAYSFRNSQPDAWRKHIDETASLLYEEFWVPILDQLSQLGITSRAELVWFPQGGSNVFPMHAAWKKTNTDEGRFWLLDEFTLRYAPSVRALLLKHAPVKNGCDDMLMVSNPMGDLEYSEIECAWVMRIRSRKSVQLLHGEEATTEAVSASIAGKKVVHFSSHALFDLNHPLDSSLLLAHNSRLSLRDLMPILQSDAPAMVVLSACETGMARVTSTPDESLGFPAAFLHGGSSTVLSTLWPVDDQATALLVSRFYWELSKGDMSPARALREAQIWLRRVTAKELRRLLGELKDAPPPAGPTAARLRTALRVESSEACPFAEPYFWAAFTISGKE
jgi:CHAT domain-containing protein/tetratricopeptide (TPR) repeat protein